MAIKTYSVGTNSGVRRLDDLTGPWVDVPLNLLSNTNKIFLTPLRDVETDPLDNTKVFVVGTRNIGAAIGGIYVSSNAGAVWVQPAGDLVSGSYDFATFFEVSVVDSNIIYACGSNGYVFKSLDGGLTFNKTTTLPTSTGLADLAKTSYALHFITPLIGVVSLDGFMYKTVDGGATWVALNSGVTLPGGFIVGVHISADQLIINALTIDGLWRSSNGGINWIQQVSISSRQGLHLTWTDDNSLWALCGGSQRFETLNAGTTWTEINPFVLSDPSNRAGHLHNYPDGFFSEDTNALSTSNAFLTGTLSETSPYGIEAIWSQEDITPSEPCGCPPGFTYNFTSGLCEGFSVTPIIANGPIYDVKAGNKIFNYGAQGTNFYENVDSKPYPITSLGTIMRDSFAVPLIVTNTVVNDLWGDVQGPDTLNGRLNVAGIWADLVMVGTDQPPTSEWIGFTACVVVPTTKVYYIGLGADNKARFKIDSILIASIGQCTNPFVFEKWHVFPITLTAGTHIIELEGWNCGDNASFGAEIYDASLAQLIGMTLEAQLDAVTLFSTKNKVGSNFDLGQYSGYSCPVGWSLSLCSGAYQCVKADEVPFAPCNCYLATDCNNPQSTLLLTTENPLNPTLTYQFVGYPDICWTIEASGMCPPNDVFTDVVDSFLTCFECGGICYELVDCAAVEPNQIVSNDLSAVLGQVIKQEFCPDICWLVSAAVPCNGLVNVITIVANYVDCAACLPLPVPTPPLVLNPRVIKPGYTPPACDIDYIKKVSCNFAEAMFQHVASRRYGLKFCCETDMNKWWIKKQLLDLKSIFDPDACLETPLDCCPPCDVVAQLLVIQTRGCLAPDSVSAILQIP